MNTEKVGPSYYWLSFSIWEVKVKSEHPQTDVHANFRGQCANSLLNSELSD